MPWGVQGDGRVVLDRMSDAVGGSRSAAITVGTVSGPTTSVPWGSQSVERDERVVWVRDNARRSGGGVVVVV